MQQKRLSPFILLLLSVLLWFSVACSTSEASPTADAASATPVVLVETVVVVATPTPLTAATAAATPTAEPVALLSPTPTSSPQPVAMVTATATTAVLPSPTPIAATPGTAPTILHFRANVETADPGQTIQLEWASSGATTASITRIDNFRVVESWSVSPTGSHAYMVDSALRDSILFTLIVGDAQGRQAETSLRIPLNCPYDWFFSPAPEGCPIGPARYSGGAEQRFQNGIMIWEQAEQQIYILYNEGNVRWDVVTDTWQDGEPICQITGVPAGLYHPVRGFGKVWCNSDTIRNRLGWALGEEAGGYETAVQSAYTVSYSYIHYIRAADGNVWHLLPERTGWEKIVTP
jgi:hypothetical protein